MAKAVAFFMVGFFARADSLSARLALASNLLLTI